MHTVVRYNRRGEKLNPTYWLVVQGHYKNRRGKYRELLGFWVPKPLKRLRKQDRSIILNKNRTRYWIAEGARIPFKAHRHMSFFGLLNEPWISWGRKTTFMVPEKEVLLRRDCNKEFERNFVDPIDDQRSREEALENMLLRRVKIQQRLLEEFGTLDQSQVVENLILEDSEAEDDDDILLRSTKFWALHNEYRRMEQNPLLVHPLRKELLFKKLNSLSEKGFYEKDQISFDNPYYSIFIRDGDRLRTSPEADHLKREIENDQASKPILKSNC